MKEMFNVWDAVAIFDHILPKLEHENDGLIFTVDAAPYYMGKCPHILKWKPLELNTIDFEAKPFPIQTKDGNQLTNVWELATLDPVSQRKVTFDFIYLSESECE